MAKNLPQRHEVPLEHQWSLESVFADEAAYRAAYADVEARIPGLEEYRGTLATSPQKLLQALDDWITAMTAAYKVVSYAGMRREEDLSNVENTARADEADGLWARLNAATAYFRPEILDLAPEQIDQFISEEPGLATYRHFFDQLGLLRGHIRSSEVEALLAEVADLAETAGRVHGVLENADMTFATIQDEDGHDVELAQGNSDHLIESLDRRVRKAAFEAYADGYIRLKNTFAAALAGAVKRDVFFARAHDYKSSLEATMQPNNIPAEVFYNLISTVRSNLPLWHRYWAIRRRALGVGELQAYDVHVPLASAEETIHYDRGVEMLMQGLAPLGEQYTRIARQGLTVDRWVDRYANVGKGSGAFSAGTYGTRPFMMQNYDDDLLSLSTLAHELGHSMHSYLTWDTQPPVYGDYSMFAAETASNFNQALLRAHLLAANDDPRFQVAVISEGMANFLRYFFIMPILAQFELEMHERAERGEALTADDMSAKTAELFGEGFGNAVVMDQERVGIIWAQFPHLYGNFYVYQYATGISAANALAAAVLDEGQPAAQRYIGFLKAGSSAYPLDALRDAGIDMTTPAPVERAFKVLEGLIDRLDKIVGDGPLPWLPKQEA